jgi:UDPglucose 6-dehydrogenase
MRISVIGTGHVGVVTCATLARLGHDVVGTDREQGKIDALRGGKTPFYEPGLDELLQEGLAAGRLSFTSDLSEAVAGSQVVFICVGTPPRLSGEANLVAVENAASEAGRAATGPLVIVEKSTVPYGTSKRLVRSLQRERSDLKGQLEVASNPEFLREGRAVEDSLFPERILVGADSETAHETMREVYATQISAGVPYIATSVASAELAKHASNAFLALKISFANALAQICERADADVREVTAVMGTDQRIGPAFLDAGMGYGGSCFPKDLVAFDRLSSGLGYDFALLREIARINEEAVNAVLTKVHDALWNLEGKRVALLGLAFKPETDDVRFAPALALARSLLEGGATVVGYDPEAAANAQAEVEGLEIAESAYEAAKGSHCVVLCTEWDEFRKLDPDQLKAELEYPIIVDGRNLLSEDDFVSRGFTYYPIGRSPVAEGSE